MKKIFLIVWLICFPFIPALAVKMPNLYQTEVPVASQTYDVREQAIKDGLLQVLIKISGNIEIDKNPVIKLGLKRANYYVQEFSYSPDSRDSSQYQLRIGYEPRDVNQLLAKAKVAHWNENRPLMLVWLTVTDKQHITSIIGNEMPGTLFDKMKQEGKNYGLPLIFPVMDVDDMNRVSADDIKSMNLAVLHNAAERYLPDALLIGQIEENRYGSRSEWHLITKNRQWHLKAANNSTDELIVYVMSQVSEIISGRYTEKLTKPQLTWIKLEVSRIKKRKDIAKLVQYLKHVVNVQKIELTQIEGDVVMLAVQVQGSLASFEQSILDNQHLVLKTEDDANTKLIYEWIK